jgi:hypothetical protein
MTNGAFADIAPDLAFSAHTALGPEYWRKDEHLRGSRVLVIADRELLRAYVRLHELAHLWIHQDLVHDIWQSLDVDEASEVGVDYAVMPRRPGVYMRSFFSELSERAEPPPPELAHVLETVPVLVREAKTDRDRFIAQLVQRRIDERSYRVVYVDRDASFYIEDLQPSLPDLHAWLPLMQERA